MCFEPLPVDYFKDIELTGTFAKDSDRIADIKARVLANKAISTLDVFILELGNPNLALQAYNALNNGGGVVTLNALGVSSTYITKLTAIFNMEVPRYRYESAMAIDMISNDMNSLNSFANYVKEKGLTDVSLYQVSSQNITTTIRSLARDWYLDNNE
jgi:hypothetical protein